MLPKFKNTFTSNPKESEDSFADPSVGEGFVGDKIDALQGIFTFIIFGGVILGGVGLFGYNFYLDKQKESALSALESRWASFDFNRTEELIEFADKIEKLKEVLENKIDYRRVLRAFETLIVDGVRVTALTVKSEGGAVTVLATLSTQSVPSYVTQIRTLSHNTIGLSDIRIERFDVNTETGEVEFSLEGNLDVELLPNVENIITTVQDVPETVPQPQETPEEQPEEQEETS